MDRQIRNPTPPQEEEEEEETKTQDVDDIEEDTPEDAFGNAFQLRELSAAARAREQAIQAEVDAELRVEVQEQQATRNRVGDAVGEHGDPLFHRDAAGEAPIPGTQAHDAWLRRHVNSLPP
jgi:hypothetical protein